MFISYFSFFILTWVYCSIGSLIGHNSQAAPACLVCLIQVCLSPHFWLRSTASATFHSTVRFLRLPRIHARRQVMTSYWLPHRATTLNRGTFGSLQPLQLPWGVSVVIDVNHRLYTKYSNDLFIYSMYSVFCVTSLIIVPMSQHL